MNEAEILFIRSRDEATKARHSLRVCRRRGDGKVGAVIFGI